MSRTAYLVLSDGTVFEGTSFGAPARAAGEVVFNTSMTGYQEVLTDPSYAGQIVTMTYPLIGNYGINSEDFESRAVQVRGLVVREHCNEPSHWQSTSTLGEFLTARGIPAIEGIDTRALTRRLRSEGVMMGTITSDEAPAEALERLRDQPLYGATDFVRAVTTQGPYGWKDGRAVLAKPPSLTLPREGGEDPALLPREGGEDPALLPREGGEDLSPPPPGGGQAPVLRDEGRKGGQDPAPPPHIVVMDFGLKFNILRSLVQRGCTVTAVPATATLDQLLSMRPDGVVLSPGPGDPALLDYAVETVRGLLDHRSVEGLPIPMLGICLGHQLVGRALGAGTFKLKFGHRGANHPVQDLETGRVHITSQNHGYALDRAGLDPEVDVTQLSLHDGTVEGLRHRRLPVLTIQYHSEASPGPQDNMYIFDRFLDLVHRHLLLQHDSGGRISLLEQ